MTLTHMLFLSDGIYLVFIQNPKFSDVQAVRSTNKLCNLFPFSLGFDCLLKICITLQQRNLGSDCCGKSCMRKSGEKSGQRLPIVCSEVAQELRHLPVVSARAIWQPNLGLAMNFTDTDSDLLT